MQFAVLRFYHRNKEIENGARLLGDVPSKDDTKADNSASSNSKKDKKAAAVAKMMEEKTKTETSLKETTLIPFIKIS